MVECESDSEILGELPLVSEESLMLRVPAVHFILQARVALR